MMMETYWLIRDDEVRAKMSRRRCSSPLKPQIITRKEQNESAEIDYLRDRVEKLTVQLLRSERRNALHEGYESQLRARQNHDESTKRIQEDVTKMTTNAK